MNCILILQKMQRKLTFDSDNFNQINYVTPYLGHAHSGIIDKSSKISSYSRDQFSPLLSTKQNRKPHRHNRNYSDLTSPTMNKPQSSEFRELRELRDWDGNKMSLEHRMQRMEQKLAATESKLLEITRKEQMYHRVEDKLLGVSRNQMQAKLYDMNICLSQVRVKIEKMEKLYSDQPQIFSKALTSKPELVHHNSPGELSNQKMDKFVEKISQINLQLVQSLRKEFKQKLNELNQKMRAISVNSSKEYEQAANPENQFFKTNRKYSANPISFIYEQYIRKNEQQSRKQSATTLAQKENLHCLNQITYHIDPQGFLLDENNNYLVNNNMKQIKLSERELRMLRKLNILQY